MRGAAALALLALGACAQAQGPSFPEGPFGRLSFGPNWGGQRPVVSAESPTVQRVRGVQAVVPEPLRPEDGSIWPAREAPRATLADPEDVLRGTPPRGSSTNPDFLAPPQPSAPRRPPLTGLEGLPPAPATARRSDGQVIPTPGGPVVTTGGAGNVRTTISPQGSGLAIQDGGMTTLITPGQPPRVVPSPR